MPNALITLLLLLGGANRPERGTAPAPPAAPAVTNERRGLAGVRQLGRGVRLRRRARRARPE